MGSGNWFKSMIIRKTNKALPKQMNNSKHTIESASKNHSLKVSNSSCRSISCVNPENGTPIKDAAATRIQSAFRAFKARKNLRYLKRAKRLQILSLSHSVKKQVLTASRYVHSWCNIQSEIKTRRSCMVTEGRIKQKKEENQMKLEAELHNLEIEWCGGHEAMEEILARIQHREEAAIKRERTMAYAFSHQWRANNGQKQGHFLYDFEKGGWSWMDRWIAARPWETKFPSLLSSAPNKQPKKPNKVSKKASSSYANGDSNRLSKPQHEKKIINSNHSIAKQEKIMKDHCLQNG